MKKIELELTNETGLHARPASLFVKMASDYISEIKIIKADRSCDAKSIMGVLSLGVMQGDKLAIEADGEDEEVALESLKKLIESNFGEK